VFQRVKKKINLFFIYGSFNDSVAQFILRRMIGLLVNNELERIWDEAVVK
jgi:hypothetical protein